jgi:hypothetical protein
LPVNFAIDARVNFDNTAMPVIASILWVVTSYFISNPEGFEWVRARDARKQFCQFLLIGIREFRKRIAKVQKNLRIVGAIGANTLYTALRKGF